MITDLLHNQSENTPMYFLVNVQDDNHDLVSIKETAKLGAIKMSLFVSMFSASQLFSS